MGMKKYDTPKQYLDSFPEVTKNLIMELKDLIFEAVPEAKEIFKSNYFRYSLTDKSKFNQQIMITGYENHIGFYPHSSIISLYEKELKDYKTGKGTIQFQNNEPLPKELIIKIVQKMKLHILENKF